MIAVMERTVEKEMLGESAEFKTLLEQVNLVAASNCAVLIQGETGTGKELIARAVHARSQCAAGPFITVNCAAIPEGLLESELFGHERGAFTGALAPRVGWLQLAHRGTLFLDEIGDLPLALQPKLLRAIQEREFERLGGSQTIHVDVRIVAATNQSLPQMVQDRVFRADLYYRLNVFPIIAPPLRQRVGDIPILVRHFVRSYAARMNKTIDEVPEQVMQLLCGYDWPGNIRELQNFVERAVLMTDGKQLRAPLAELAVMMPGRSSARGDTLPGKTLTDMERVHIVQTLEKTNWLVGGREGAAAKLGLPRTTLISKMRKLGIARNPSASWEMPDRAFSHTVGNK
jgi:formate hydrogenlyase transcriptional activator